MALQSGGLLYHLYNQASYMVLDLPGITPVTLSVVRSLYLWRGFLVICVISLGRERVLTVPHLCRLTCRATR